MYGDAPMLSSAGMNEDKAQGTRHKSQGTTRRQRCDLSLVLCALCLAALGASCASAPVAAPTPKEPPVVSYEDKLSWIIRLEDQLTPDIIA